MTYRYGGIFPCVKPTTNLPDSAATFASDATTAYENGLREGRKQILKWVSDGLEQLAPLLTRGGWPAKTLLEGFTRQVQKYLRTGDLPSEGNEP